MRIGDPVKLIRKITQEPLEMELTQFLIHSPSPAVEVRWKTDRYKYKLDLVKNEVLAIDATQTHRQTMKVWYYVSEDDRLALTEAFWVERKKGKKS